MTETTMDEDIRALARVHEAMRATSALFEVLLKEDTLDAGLAAVEASEVLLRDVFTAAIRYLPMPDAFEFGYVYGTLRTARMHRGALDAVVREVADDAASHPMVRMIHRWRTIPVLAPA